MALQTTRTASQDRSTTTQSNDQPTGPETDASLLLPRPRAGDCDLVSGKDARALHALIERAFALLDEAADGDGGEATGAPTRSPAKPVLGAAPGSEIRHRPSFAARILKTLGALAVVFVVGLVPLQRILMPVSSEALVNAPAFLVHAPIDGVLSGDMFVGSHVERDMPLATVVGPDGPAHAVSVVSAGSGKLWEVRFRPGDRVARGDVIARVVACTAASITASVSESVYDKLAPGTPARFHFYGSNRFYHGEVAKLLGHSQGADDYVISPGSVTRGAYRVVVSMPELGTTKDCAVGRRGAVVFNPPAS